MICSSFKFRFSRGSALDFSNSGRIHRCAACQKNNRIGGIFFLTVATSQVVFFQLNCLFSHAFSQITCNGNINNKNNNKEPSALTFQEPPYQKITGVCNSKQQGFLWNLHENSKKESECLNDFRSAKSLSDSFATAHPPRCSSKKSFSSEPNRLFSMAGGGEEPQETAEAQQIAVPASNDDIVYDVRNAGVEAGADLSNHQNSENRIDKNQNSEDNDGNGDGVRSAVLGAGADVVNHQNFEDAIDDKVENTKLSPSSAVSSKEKTVETSTHVNGQDDQTDKEDSNLAPKVYWRPPKKGELLYRLTDQSILSLTPGDITKWSVDGKQDAIVNAANQRMTGGGGVDGAIHRAAGPELYELCRNEPEVAPGVRCWTGDAVITRAGRLPVKYVIHTVGPIYYSPSRKGAKESPEKLLYDAYKNTMARANEKKVKYICFPAISCGVYGYPYEEAAPISVRAVKENLGDVKEVHFKFFDSPVFDEWKLVADNVFEPLTKESPEI